MLGFTLAVALGGFGLFGTAPANADCTVNVPPGPCDGDCTVNILADCNGDCTVNVLDPCDTGATCLLNTPVDALDICSGPNVVAVSGTGSINPGLPCPPSGCTIHLDFTAVFAGPNAQGTASCTFDGVDNFAGGATVLAGSGSGTINCSGGATANGTVTFSRTGVVVDVGGSIGVNAATGCVVDVTLAFHPVTPPPVTTFGVHGGGTITCP